MQRYVFIVILLIHLFFGSTVIMPVWGSESAVHSESKVFAFAGFEYRIPNQGEEFSMNIGVDLNGDKAQFHVDSSRVIGKRVNVIRPVESELSEDINDTIKALEQSPLEELWCSDFLAMIGDDLRLLEQTSGISRYQFSPKAGQDADKDDEEFLSHLQAFVSIDTTSGALLSFEMKNVESFRPVIIAKIKRFYMLVNCGRYGEHYYYVKHLSTHVSGSVGFKSFEDFESKNIYDLRKAVNEFKQ